MPKQLPEILSIIPTRSGSTEIKNKNNLSGLEMNYVHSYDINTEFDFKIAEYLMDALKDNEIE